MTRFRLQTRRDLRWNLGYDPALWAGSWQREKAIYAYSRSLPDIRSQYPDVKGTFTSLLVPSSRENEARVGRY
jgi:hypothetical protein